MIKKILDKFDKEEFPRIKEYFNIKMENPDYYPEDTVSKQAFYDLVKKRLTNTILNEMEGKGLDYKHAQDVVGPLYDTIDRHGSMLQQNTNMSEIMNPAEIDNPFSLDNISKNEYGSPVSPLLNDSVTSLTGFQTNKQKQLEERKEHNQKVMRQYGINKPTVQPVQSAQPQGVIDAVDRFRMKKSVSRKDVIQLLNCLSNSIKNDKINARLNKSVKMEPPSLTVTKSVKNVITPKEQRMIAFEVIDYYLYSMIKKSAQRKPMTEHKRRILQLLAQDKKMSIPELAKKIGIATRNIELNIADLEKDGLLRHEGEAASKTGRWIVEDAPSDVE